MFVIFWAFLITKIQKDSHYLGCRVQAAILVRLEGKRRQKPVIMINADIFDAFQTYFDKLFAPFLMNSHPYGLAKQLYRTTHTPVVLTSRPASLNNLSYAHSYGARVPLMRLEQPISGSATRQISQTSLSASQSTLQDSKVKTPPHQYYPEDSKYDELVRNLHQKVQELSRKVTKNSEDIKGLKKIQKLKVPADVTLSQELQKLNSRQMTSGQECLLKIKTLQDQLNEVQSKFSKLQPANPQIAYSKFDEKLLFKIKALTEQRVKQETAKIKLIIENQISKISHELRWQIEKQKHQSASVKSRTKYPFSSTKIVHSQFIEAPFKKNSASRVSTRGSSESPRSGKILMSKETTYFVDRQGFLLDQNNYYLLDSSQKMIRLSSKMLADLRVEGLLE